VAIAYLLEYLGRCNAERVRGAARALAAGHRRHEG